MCKKGTFPDAIVRDTDGQTSFLSQCSKFATGYIHGSDDTDMFPTLRKLLFGNCHLLGRDSWFESLGLRLISP
jgi:hypothetical protein